MHVHVINCMILSCIVLIIHGHIHGIYSQESTDGGTGPGKDYVLYSESEEDMNTWIKVHIHVHVL